MSDLTQTVLPRSAITIDPKFNARGTLEGVQELSESMDKEGMRIPVIVHQKRVKDGALPRYALIAGFRRMAAAEMLNLDEIPVTILPAKTKKVELYRVNLLENVVRKSLNPMDEAHAVKRLLDSGDTRESVAMTLGWKQTLVTQRLALLEYTDLVQAAVRDDRIGVSAARTISALPEDAQEQFIDRAVSISNNRLRELVDSEIERRTGAATPPEAADAPSAETPDAPDGPEAVDPAALQSEIIQNYLALITAHVEDDTSRARCTIAVRSIDWGVLTLDDLESLVTVTTVINNELDIEVGELDAPGSIPIEGDESDESSEV